MAASDLVATCLREIMWSRCGTSRSRHTGLVQTPPPPSAQYFDGWYADMAGSPAKDEVKQRHLGLPPHLLSTSLLGWAGLGEVAAALRLSPGDTLLDLACGRGGYGLEIATRTGARLVGVDFSAEAVRQARESAVRLGRPADFRVGDLAATVQVRERPAGGLASGPCGRRPRPLIPAATRRSRPSATRACARWKPSA